MCDYMFVRLVYKIDVLIVPLNLVNDAMLFSDLEVSLLQIIIIIFFFKYGCPKVQLSCKNCVGWFNRWLKCRPKPHQNAEQKSTDGSR